MFAHDITTSFVHIWRWRGERIRQFQVVTDTVQLAQLPGLAQPGLIRALHRLEKEVLPGDLDDGDVIMLPGAGHELPVKTVRLGQGGLILTMSSAGDAPVAAQLVTLPAATYLRKTPLASADLQRRLAVAGR